MSNNSFGSKLDKFFGIKERGSTIRTEIVAGLVTFLAMIYILTVNPNQILWGGVLDPRWSSVFMATAFGAVIGTLLMAFLAKLPLAQASGMGLNAMVGTMVGGASGFAFSFGNAMFMVLLDGVVFLLLSCISIKGKALRQYVFEGIPTSLKVAIPAGIGLFIAYIGFQNAGIIIGDPYVQVALCDLTHLDSCKPAIVCLIGLFAIVIMSHWKIKGAVVFGILIAAIVGIPLGVTDLSVLAGNTPGITWQFWNNFGDFFGMTENSVFLSAFKGGWNLPEGSLFTFIMLTISFAMIDMFDTMGTCLGCCSAAGLLEEDGTPIAYDKIMYSDSIATCTGALLGTSTVTTFVESGAGVAAGGKTGLTALTTAILFFLSMFLLPVFAAIPSAATSCALIYVGALMMKNITKVNFDSIRVAVPAFLTIIMMPLAYSITKGIGMGLISFVIISLITYPVDLILWKNGKRDHAPTWRISLFTAIVTILFAVYFFVPTVL